MAQRVSSEDRFSAWVRDVSRLLAAYRDLSATTATHGALIGKAREVFVSEVLRRFLPQALHLGAGQIVDQSETPSREIDVIVYRHDMPLLSSLADTGLYFAEGVVATIEVKSTLDASTLREALDNCLSVKMLDVEYPSKQGKASDFCDARYWTPATYIFGYGGYKTQLPKLKTALLNWIRDKGIESLHQLPEVIATEGCVVIKNDERYACLDSNAILHRVGCRPVFLAARDETPLRWLIHHLLVQLLNSDSRILPTKSGLRAVLAGSRGARRAVEDAAEFWGEWDRTNGQIIRMD